MLYDALAQMHEDIVHISEALIHKYADNIQKRHSITPHLTSIISGHNRLRTFTNNRA